MELSEYRHIFENEDSHFFYLGNHNLILFLIEKFVRLGDKGLKILDAGCGTGLLAKKLNRFGDVVGMDISDEALRFARKRGINVLKGSITKLPFREKTFDLVVSIDVLYHRAVKSDRKALREFFRVLKPDGRLIVRVPANNWLWRSCDLQVHTRERYSALGLRKKLMDCGFFVEKISYVNAPLLPAAILSFLWERLTKAKKSTSPLVKLPSFLNYFISQLLTSERFLLSHMDLPFGLGVIALARKVKKP